VFIQSWLYLFDDTLNSSDSGFSAGVKVNN